MNKHLILKKQLQNYTSFEQHNPLILQEFKKYLTDGGAHMQKQTTNANPRIRFRFQNPLLFEEAKKLHKTLSEHGYCSPNAFKFTLGNKTNVSFYTYSLKTLNTLYNLYYPHNGSQKRKKNQSLVNYKKQQFLQEYLQFNEHSEYIQAILVGSLLGDATANQTRYKTRVVFDMSIKNKEYLFALHSIFKDEGYCNENTPKVLGDYRSYSFKTWALQSLNKLYSLFYREPTLLEKELYFRYFKEKKLLRKIKKIPSNIDRYLTPISLAHWIMGDGYFLKKQKTLYICTNSFSLNCIILLQKAILKNFNINITYHKSRKSKITNEQQYQLYISRVQLQTLIPKIKPYFVLSMLYKLGL